MADIDLGAVGVVKCVVYDKDGNKIDAVSIKPRGNSKPYPLAQKVLRGVVRLINRRRTFQEENP